MPKFDVLSDIHIDMWIRVQNPDYAQEKKMRFLLSKILPENPSEVLLIPGDLGHYNWQTIMFLKLLRETYKTIIWTHGNHDLYMVSKSVADAYNQDSFLRLKEMINLASEVDGVHYLDGNIVTVDGVNVGGCSMWYDSTYASEVHYLSEIRINDLWKSTMNDARLIYVNTPSGRLNWKAYCKEQYAKLEAIHTQCDVIISHVCPTWSNLLPKWHEEGSTFYHFDGRPLLKNLAGKTWVYGHTHDPYDFIHKDGCHMICNALGYPETPYWETQLFPQKITTIEV